MWLDIMKREIDHYGVFFGANVGFLFQGGEAQNASGYTGPDFFEFRPSFSSMRSPHRIQMRNQAPPGDLPTDPLFDFMKPGVASGRKLHAISDPGGSNEVGEICFELNRMYGSVQRFRMAIEMNPVLLRRELSSTNLQPLIVIAQAAGYSSLVKEARQLLRFLPRKLLIVMEQPGAMLPDDAIPIRTRLSLSDVTSSRWEAWGGFLTHQLCRGET